MKCIVYFYGRVLPRLRFPRFFAIRHVERRQVTQNTLSSNWKPRAQVVKILQYTVHGENLARKGGRNPSKYHMPFYWTHWGRVFCGLRGRSLLDKRTKSIDCTGIRVRAIAAQTVKRRYVVGRKGGTPYTRRLYNLPRGNRGGGRGGSAVYDYQRCYIFLGARMGGRQWMEEGELSGGKRRPWYFKFSHYTSRCEWSPHHPPGFSWTQPPLRSSFVVATL